MQASICNTQRITQTFENFKDGPNSVCKTFKFMPKYECLHFQNLYMENL